MDDKLQLMQPPGEWFAGPFMKDPTANKARVLGRVYNPLTQERLILPLRKEVAIYDNSTIMDVAGCRNQCTYCWVDPKVLAGSHKTLEKHGARWLTAEAAAQKMVDHTKRHGTKNMNITGGEVFLTPEWTWDVVQVLEQESSGIIVLDSMGSDLLDCPEMYDFLASIKDRVLIFLSLKAHWDDYPAIANAPSEAAEHPYVALEELWHRGIPAVPQMLGAFFYTLRMQDIADRLMQIHPDGAKILQIDKFSDFRTVVNRSTPAKRLKRTGFCYSVQDRKDGTANVMTPTEAKNEWIQVLQSIYGDSYEAPPHGAGEMPLMNVDANLEASLAYVRKTIFNK